VKCGFRCSLAIGGANSAEQEGCGRGNSCGRRRGEQPKPKLGDYEELLHRWLEQDAQRPKRQRRTARRLFEDLPGRHGYAGAYDSVQRVVEACKQSRGGLARTQALIPQIFPPGEAIKFASSYADKGDHLLLKASWTKGGQPQAIPVRTEAQRSVLDRAHRSAGGGSLIPS
jgi:hypothetical protein